MRVMRSRGALRFERWTMLTTLSLLLNLNLVRRYATFQAATTKVA